MCIHPSPDGDGTISVPELRTVMANLGRDISDRELNEIIASADKDRNGTIDFEEFLDLMEHQAERSSSDEELLAAFQVFDRDGSGNISLAELSDVMRSLGETLTKTELKEMMREADENGDGEINFQGTFSTSMIISRISSYRAFTLAEFRRVSRKATLPMIDPHSFVVDDARVFHVMIFRLQSHFSQHCYRFVPTNFTLCISCNSTYIEFGSL